MYIIIHITIVVFMLNKGSTFGSFGSNAAKLEQWVIKIKNLNTVSYVVS